MYTYMFPYIYIYIHISTHTRAVFIFCSRTCLRICVLSWACRVMRFLFSSFLSTPPLLHTCHMIWTTYCSSAGVLLRACRMTRFPPLLFPSSPTPPIIYMIISLLTSYLRLVWRRVCVCETERDRERACACVCAQVWRRGVYFFPPPLHPPLLYTWLIMFIIYCVSSPCRALVGWRGVFPFCFSSPPPPILWYIYIIYIYHI